MQVMRLSIEHFFLNTRAACHGELCKTREIHAFLHEILFRTRKLAALAHECCMKHNTKRNFNHGRPFKTHSNQSCLPWSTVSKTMRVGHLFTEYWAKFVHM